MTSAQLRAALVASLVADTAAESRVFNSRLEALGPDDVKDGPAINVRSNRRSDAPAAEGSGLFVRTEEFLIEGMLQGAPLDSNRAADIGIAEALDAFEDEVRDCLVLGAWRPARSGVGDISANLGTELNGKRYGGFSMTYRFTYPIQYVRDDGVRGHVVHETTNPIGAPKATTEIEIDTTSQGG